MRLVLPTLLGIAKTKFPHEAGVTPEEDSHLRSLREEVPPTALLYHLEAEPFRVVAVEDLIEAELLQEVSAEGVEARMYHHWPPECSSMGSMDSSDMMYSHSSRSLCRFRCRIALSVLPY